MATKDGRAQIWYADGNGNVEGYTESVDDIAGTIIDAYNEHFGTGIGIWTPETKTLQVGGTVPNWNAYEKIEMPEEPKYFRIYLQDYASNMIGWLDGNIITLCMIENSNEIVLAAGGTVRNIIEGIDAYFNLVKNRVSSFYGISIENLQIVNSEDSYSVGDEIPYFSECERI